MTLLKDTQTVPVLSDLPSVSIDSTFSRQQILDLATTLSSGALRTEDLQAYTGLDAQSLVLVRTLSRVLQEYQNHEQGTPRMTFGELKDLETTIAESDILGKIGRTDLTLRALGVHRSILAAVGAYNSKLPDQVEAAVRSDTRYQALLSSKLPFHAKDSENGIGMETIVRYAMHTGRPYIPADISKVLNVVPDLQEYVRAFGNPNTSDQTADRIERKILGVSQLLYALKKERPDMDSSLFAQQLTELQKWPIGEHLVFRCAALCKAALLPPEDKRSFPQTGQKTPPGFFTFIQSAYDDLRLAHDYPTLARQTPYSRKEILDLRSNGEQSVVEKMINDHLIGRVAEVSAQNALLSNGYIIRGIEVKEINGRVLRDATSTRHGSAREIDIIASSPINRDDQLFVFEVKSSGVGVLRSAYGSIPRTNENTPRDIPFKSQLAALTRLAPSVAREFGYETAHVVYLVAPPENTSTFLEPHHARELRKLSGKFYDSFNPDMDETVHFNTLIVRDDGYLEPYPQPGMDYAILPPPKG